MVYEWWPDYGSGPLFRVGGGPAGAVVDVRDLGLPGGLASELAAWNSAYEEVKLPTEESMGDVEWLAHGVQLLARTRQALDGRATVIVTEPWWGEEPADD